MTTSNSIGFTPAMTRLIKSNNVTVKQRPESIPVIIEKTPMNKVNLITRAAVTLLGAAVGYKHNIISSTSKMYNVVAGAMTGLVAGAITGNVIQNKFSKEDKQ